MDEDLEKMTKRNEIMNQTFTWGMVALFLVVLGLLVRMFVFT